MSSSEEKSASVSKVQQDPDKNDGEIEEMEAKTSSSAVTPTSGPDSDIASVEELPSESKEKIQQHDVTEEISQKFSASATYLGSVFSSAWNKTTKTANDATAATTNSLNTGAAFFSSALNKVSEATSGINKSPTEENVNSDEKENKEAKEISDDSKSQEANSVSSVGATASNLFNSAFSNFGFSSQTDKGEKTENDKEVTEENNTNEKNSATKFNVGDLGTGFTSAFATIGNMAADATQTIKEKVATNHILSEFNKEQENFIKSKEHASENIGEAPWVGYKDEVELKEKILGLSQDRRNFVRAPPSGVAFEFEYADFSSTAKCLLNEDPNLEAMRYELVPKKVKEEEFWRNYFYRLSLIKQSFDLKDLERAEEDEKKNKMKTPTDDNSRAKAVSTGDESLEIMSHDNDDEFVSESYQASTSDLAEVDESIKKLGVGAENPEEWEAELEGELNEYEVINSKEDTSEWESQIQEMLDAEDSSKN